MFQWFCEVRRAFSTTECEPTWEQGNLPCSRRNREAAFWLQKQHYCCTKQKYHSTHDFWHPSLHFITGSNWQCSLLLYNYNSLTPSAQDHFCSSWHLPGLHSLMHLPWAASSRPEGTGLTLPTLPTPCSCSASSASAWVACFKFVVPILSAGEPRFEPGPACCLSLHPVCSKVPADQSLNSQEFLVWPL